MRDNINRRNILKLGTLFAAAVVVDGLLPKQLFAQTKIVDATAPSQSSLPLGNEYQNSYALENSSNFRAIYQDPQLKAAFFLFLKNVYHLYPKKRFHSLIEEVASARNSDKEIYLLAQARIGSIKPFLSEVRYALPSLAQQKAEMARQTFDLLQGSGKINGYMEIGTTGRYVGRLRSSVGIKGDVVLVHTDEPNYSLIDMVERGQPTRIGRFVPLMDYAPIAASDVADNSLGVVSNFIGFHHSPPEKRDAFVRSLHRVLRPGGRLIVRDHDVNSPQMNRMVALAHDVYNMGLDVDWSVNQKEIRNFTSMRQLVAVLQGAGFKSNGRALRQAGDPTQNTLMEFIKV